jgi:hypothetical protein
VYLLPECQVGEGCFYQILAIVEIAFYGNVANVTGGDGRHLPALDFAGAAFGVEDGDIDAGAAGTGLDRGAAGIAGGGAQDGDALVPRREHMVEQPAEQLHGQVFEGESRAVEEFLHPHIRTELDEGDDGRVGEAGIGLGAHGTQGFEGDGALGEGGDDAGGEFGVGHAAQGAEVGMAEMRPGGGHVEAAILGEAGQEHAGEIPFGRLAAGGDVAHGRFLAPPGGEQGGQAGEQDEAPRQSEVAVAGAHFPREHDGRCSGDDGAAEAACGAGRHEQAAGDFGNGGGLHLLGRQPQMAEHAAIARIAG